jgi:phospholipid/cholesterol/gamma-HCH transport system substrate-binding protein
MNTRAPSKSNIAAIFAFAGLCIGLLLFLWISFGGSVPLAAKGYRLTVEFNQASELGTQAAVEISGVQIGTVVAVGLDRRTGLTRATLQINPSYAPRPVNTRAILRQKSLLGETYVELSPGNPDARKFADGATLPRGQVAATVQLDQILSTFDPTTRQAFETWMEQGGMAISGRGEALNAALAELYPFATNTDAVLAVLRRDSSATSALLSDGAQVLKAVAANPTELQSLIRAADQVFSTTASRNQALAAAFRATPAFLTATRQTVAQLDKFADDAQPLVDELKPAATQLSPALEQTAQLAPQLRTVMQALAPLTSASKGGVPAIQRFLTASEPLLKRLTPYLGDFVPIFDYLGDYRQELAAFFANTAAATQATSQGLTSSALKHYLRISAPVNPEALAAYANRPESNRTNPYMAPGGYNQLRAGLESFSAALCTENPLPTISPTIPATLAQVLTSVYYTDNPSGPACRAQAPLGKTVTGLTQTFPNLNPLP